MWNFLKCWFQGHLFNSLFFSLLFSLSLFVTVSLSLSLFWLVSPSFRRSCGSWGSSQSTPRRSRRSSTASRRSTSPTTPSTWCSTNWRSVWTCYWLNEDHSLAKRWLAPKFPRPLRKILTPSSPPHFSDSGYSSFAFLMRINLISCILNFIWEEGVKLFVTCCLLHMRVFDTRIDGLHPRNRGRVWNLIRFILVLLHRLKWDSQSRGK